MNIYIYIYSILSFSSILVPFPIILNLLWTLKVFQITIMVGRIQKWPPKLSPYGICLYIPIPLNEGRTCESGDSLSSLPWLGYVKWDNIVLCLHHCLLGRDRKSDKCITVGLEESKQHCCDWPVTVICQRSIVSLQELRMNPTDK